MGSCDRACEAAPPHTRTFHSGGFSFFVCTLHPHRCLYPKRAKDVSAGPDAASSSNHQSLVVEPSARCAGGTRDLSLSSDFYLCERCSHCPLVDYLGPSLVQGLQSCLAVEILHVQFGADLILPSLTVSLVETQVLPTDGANCRGSIWGSGPTGGRFWPKGPTTMNL